MRRELLKSLPALTQFYRLTPMDIEQMTYREVAEYLTQMDEARRAEERAVKHGR